MPKMLVLAEKPSVAKDYAAALNCNQKGDGYFEGNNYVITYSFGHLFTLKDPNDYNEKYKKWSLEDLPIIPSRMEVKLIDDPGVKKQFKIIKELIQRPDINAIVHGGDAGREGEIIQRYIIQATGTKKPVLRLWLSALTDEDIKKGFANLKPASEYDNLYLSAQARSELDWILGLNFTRAYTVKKGGGKVMLSIGRCQTPILALICKRDNEIKNFKPNTYWEAVSSFSSGYTGKWIKDNNTHIDKIDAAQKIKTDVEGNEGLITDIKKENKKLPHPLLFNLTNLQRTMNRKYGYSAQKTLDLMQSLYETHKILSYPRTAARCISESMIDELPGIIKCLNFGKFKSYAEYCLNLKALPVSKRLANDKEVTDHTAIIPVKNNIEKVYSSLKEDEKNVFDEVALSFLACFFGEHVYESTTVTTTVNSHDFITHGKTVIELGWKKVYQEPEDKKDEENEEQDNLPELNKGQKVKSTEVKILEKQTKPPKQFTEDTLLKFMENPLGSIEEETLKQAIKGHGIGTDATRASFIEILLKRGFIVREKKALVSTQLGQDLINAIDLDYLKSPELTAKWEFNLERIAAGEVKKDDFMNETITVIKDGISHLKTTKPEALIEKTIISLGKCPICKTGNIVQNKAGFGCSKWKEGCKFFIGEIAGKKISETQVKKLITKGKTDVIKGFKSKEGKSFDAELIIKDGRVSFQFTKK